MVIYDDMIRTGSSLLGAARAYRDAGAERLYAIAIHGVMPGRSAQRLRESGLFERIVLTDSHPHAREVAAGQQGFLVVRSVASLLHRAITTGVEV